MERRYTAKSAVDSDPRFEHEDFDYDGRQSKSSKCYLYSFGVGVLVLLCFAFYSSGAGFSKIEPTEVDTLNPFAATEVESGAITPPEKKSFQTIPDLQMPLKVAPQSKAMVPAPTESKLKQMALLNKKCLSLIKDARDIKWSGAVMETDERALLITSHLQTELRKLLTMRFGENPTILVEMLLQFPASMPDFAEKGAEGRIVIEMAPIAHAPYSVYNFLEMVRRFKKGAFHRNAGHVVQAMATMDKPASEADKTTSFTMAFQEYSPLFPHKQFTLGYAGRPGGPAFYISTIDNTENHGPASQGSKSEADSCFGKLHDRASEELAKRMLKQPGKEKKGAGFISDKVNFIVIKSLRILSPVDAGADIPTVNLDKDP